LAKTQRQHDWEIHQCSEQEKINKVKTEAYI
jgi:hypothetical protein